MAKRKRLTPAQGFGSVDTPLAPPVSGTSPPVASVAGQSAAEAALQEVTQEIRAAREEGRLIRMIPLDAIAEDHLVRDRMVVEDEDMAALVASIQARGQKSPIEVVETEPGRFGLISGWRRLQALRRLRGASPDDDGRFGRVRALVITPQDAGDSYVAMVEENEIRADLSHYERARIVARSVIAGAFPDTQTALRTLFVNASRAKRSKIKSFMSVVEQLDDVLQFPTHLGERLGLELAGRLQSDAGFAQTLSDALRRSPADSLETEGDIIRKTLSQSDKSEGKGRKTMSRADRELAPGIWLDASSKPGRMVLTGKGVSDTFVEGLQNWLAGQQDR